MGRCKLNSFLLIFSLVLVLIACNSDEEISNVENAPEAGGGELNVALQSVPPALDPHVTASTMTAEMARHIYEPLVAVDENFEVQPMLADWEVNDDYTTYTFRLRDGVTFHNGEEVTSEDVIASLERWLSINKKAAMSLGEDVEITAVDDETVQIVHEDTNFLTLETLAMPSQFGAIMPREIAEAAGAEPIQEFVGTGPFKVRDYIADQYLIVDEYEGYVPREEEPSGLAGAKNALVDTIKFEFVSDETTRLAGLLSEEYDIVRNLPYDNYDQLESASNAEPQLSEGGTDVIVFNKKEGIFTDKKARQALQAGLDLEALSIGTYADERFFELNSSLSTENQINWYTEAGREYYNQNNKELFQELLDESSYDGETVRILASNNITHYNMAIALQQQLESLGMDTSLETLDFSTVLEYREDPAVWDILVIDTPTESNPTLSNYLDSNYEFAGWTNSKEIDEIISQIRKSKSYEENSELVDDLHEAFYDYVPFIMPSKRYLLAGVSTNLEGYRDFSNGTVLWNVVKK